MNETTVRRGSELRLERLIAAPPERVFALWIDPKLLVQWWGPEGYQTPSLSLDPQPGGKWTTVMRTAEGVLRTASGVYRAIEPPRRLVFTWAWVDEAGVRGHETQVTVTFDSVPGGTLLVVHHKEFADDGACTRHGVAWSSSFDRLSALATAG